MAVLHVDGLSLELGGELEQATASVYPGGHEVTGTSDRWIDPASICAQLEAAGFEVVASNGSAAGFSLVAARGEDTVAMTFGGPPQRLLFAQVTRPSRYAPLPVRDGSFVWDGTRWPAFFSDGMLASAPDGDDVYIVASTRDVGDPCALYRGWAARSGYEVEDPVNAWEEEPDLAVERGLRFRDQRHSARLEIEDDLVTLFILRQPGT